jgi:hypothetical protein
MRTAHSRLQQQAGAFLNLTPAPLQTGDLIHSLKPRMVDANRNLTVQALQLVGKLARAMGKAIAREARPILSPSVKNLSDPKTQVCTGPRSAAGLVGMCQHVLLAGSGHGWVACRHCREQHQVELPGHDAGPVQGIHMESGSMA